ncbi:Flp pilus assembly complex ATPase component TadA [Candidimonas humi]|uniref:GspE/PulE family protein n=1 Tax=Candidimonas humi TaxID=683355 RepID=A0ABV8NSS9_9BURK|nr:ATPase, T2SS/T4P/T4SS family [Candidimonas humi]MBV6303808.1 Flp pilus assembly complex ATPase component TadA [Candidimonas humi]
MFARPGHLAQARTRPQAPVPRFDASSALDIRGPDALRAAITGGMRPLAAELRVQALAGRMCPVQLDDGCVAIFALPEHVGSDLADELARRVQAQGYALATPQRYALDASLLLSVARGQFDPRKDRAGWRQGMAGAERARSALVEVFQEVVEWGARHGASDIHLNVHWNRPESEVKFTIAGRYVEPERFRRLPTRTLADMLAVAWMEIEGGNGVVFDPQIEQQGRLCRHVDGRPIVLRWASLAADRGPSVCLRLLERDNLALGHGLESLGYLPEQVAAIERAMHSEGGAIVFAGTVGSGKSTTLACLVAGIPAHRKIITIEDPVEYLIPGAIQNTVARDAGAQGGASVYAAKLRALKRAAMNDVLLGEIRDRESGRAFVDLAGSGASLYTTTHAPSAWLACERLASEAIGIPRDFLATPGILKLVVYQALLPRLCEHCAWPASRLLAGAPGLDGRQRDGAAWRSWLERLRRLYGCDPAALRIRNPQGCSRCRNPQVPELDGCNGRTVAAEYLEPQLAPGFFDYVRRGSAAPGDGFLHGHAGHRPAPGMDTGSWHSAMDSAVCKALAGEIDPREIEARFQSFETCERLLQLRDGASLRVVA